MAADRAPLLLLPGTLCDWRVFAPQLQRLNRDNDAVRVCDLTRSSTIEGLAMQVLESAPPAFSLAGLSMGGIVAIEVCRQAPERVLRLALLDTNAAADTPERRHLRGQQAERARRGDLAGMVRDELAPRYFSVANRHREDLLRTVADMAMELGTDAFLRQVAAVDARQDRTALLSSIHCPTLVLCGEADELCPPAHHLEIAAALPRVRLQIVRECGHLSTLEQPEAVSDALQDWLDWPCSAPLD